MASSRKATATKAATATDASEGQEMTTSTTATAPEPGMTDSEKDINDLVFGNSTPVWAYPEKGNDEIRGRIIAVSKNHRRKFDPVTRTQGEPLYWQPDGKTSTEVTDKPVYDPVVTLQTRFRGWEGVLKPGEAGTDDGLRRLFITSRSRRNPGSVRDALLAACQKAQSKVRIGDYLAMRRTGGRGNINSPFQHEGDYFPAATPPEWASECAPAEKVSASGDDLFD